MGNKRKWSNSISCMERKTVNLRSTRLQSDPVAAGQQACEITTRKGGLQDRCAQTWTALEWLFGGMHNVSLHKPNDTGSTCLCLLYRQGLPLTRTHSTSIWIVPLDGWFEGSCLCLLKCWDYRWPATCPSGEI